MANLTPFDFNPTTRVLFGSGTLGELGKAARELGGKRILLVTDPGLKAAGHEDRAIDSLEAESLEVFRYEDVGENPTTAHVRACVNFARDMGGINLIVALGGGSVMDCAKGANFILTNGGEMEDYWGKNHAEKPMLPSIGVPTTAGTGSEAQCFALISHEETHRKMACGDLKARFHTVILDPELLATVPKNVVANAGVDAITHAVEAYVCTRANPVSKLFALEAWKRLEANFEALLQNSANLEAGANMLLGAHFSGAAIENSMLGGAHACANPLTAQFDVTHGTAVSLMLPHVVRYNGEVARAAYAELAKAANLEGEPVEAVAKRCSEMRAAAGLPSRLSELKITAEALQALAEDAKTQWTGNFNPRNLEVEDFLNIYQSAL